jgi:hypothetical protein
MEEYVKGLTDKSLTKHLAAWRNALPRYAALGWHVGEAQLITAIEIAEREYSRREKLRSAE